MSTNPNLSDVKARRAEIANETSLVLARLEALKQEDQELEVAERVLSRLAGHPEVLPHPSLTKALSRIPGKSPRTADMILSTLRTSPKVWSTANEVRDDLSRKKGAEVPMSTVSPTLTKLKTLGLVVRDGLNVALTERVDGEARLQLELQNEAAEAQEAPASAE
jgi:hypothetical protein